MSLTTTLCFGSFGNSNYNRTPLPHSPCSFPLPQRPNERTHNRMRCPCRFGLREEIKHRRRVFFLLLPLLLLPSEGSCDLPISSSSLVPHTDTHTRYATSSKRIIMPRYHKNVTVANKTRRAMMSRGHGMKSAGNCLSVAVFLSFFLSCTAPRRLPLPRLCVCV